MIIIINGVARSGKDEFVTITKKFVKPAHIQVHNISSIDPMKEIAKFLGWNGDKNEKTRKFLSQLKQISVEYNDYPFRYICDWLEKFSLKDVLPKIVFIHCREPKEIQKIYDYCLENQLTVKTMLVERNVDIPDNKSDQGVNDFKYDIYVQNNGNLDKFEKTTKKILNEQICFIQIDNF